MHIKLFCKRYTSQNGIPNSSMMLQYTKNTVISNGNPSFRKLAAMLNSKTNFPPKYAKNFHIFHSKNKTHTSSAFE